MDVVPKFWIGFESNANLEANNCLLITDKPKKLHLARTAQAIRNKFVLLSDNMPTSVNIVTFSWKCRFDE